MARSQPSRCSPTGSVPWASYRLTPQQIDWTIGDEATALPDGHVRPPAWSKSVEEQMKILGGQMEERTQSRKRRADERTRTADLISLRVIGHVLQGLARGCNHRIYKPVSLLRFARSCTVLRSRWYQSGIRTSNSYSLTVGQMARPRDLRSHNPPIPVSRSCSALQNRFR